MPQGKILLADDNRLVVKITSAILEDADYAVTVAWNGLEAINKAYTEDPELVILDIEMPKINGYQVCRLLKDDEITRDIPVIMLTGRDQQSDMFWGMKTGADAYMTKGFKPDQLLAVVAEQMEQSRSTGSSQKSQEKAPAQQLDESGVFSRVIDLLDSKLFQSTILNEIGVLASVGQDYRHTISAILEIISRVVGNSVGSILMFEEEDMVVLLGKPVSEEGLESVRECLLSTARELGLEVRNPERIKVTIYGEENLDSGDSAARTLSTVKVPLTAQKKVIGVMVLAAPSSPAFARDAQAILRLIQNQVTIVVDNARLYDAARQLAITDGLTKIYNHRFFQELFEKEYKRSDRYNTVFSLIMLDIDLFKRINDTYGHLCGDEILKGLANLVKSCLRSMDVVARYGGEEFAMLLPETNGPEAQQTAERIRRAVEEYIFMGNDRGLHITVSQGVATYPSPGVHERADIIAKADEALYEAKNSGRNRVVFRE